MARNYRSEYDNYHSKPAQKKKRAARNAARRKLEAGGRVEKGSDMDVHHVDGNPLNNSAKNLETGLLRAQVRAERKDLNLGVLTTLNRPELP